MSKQRSMVERMYPNMATKERRPETNQKNVVTTGRPVRSGEYDPARMYPSMAAKKIQEIGERNAPGDSILAHISPEEARLLKRRGGSGAIDPKTGLPHFAQVRDDDDDDDGPEDDGRDLGMGGTGSQADADQEAANARETMGTGDPGSEDPGSMKARHEAENLRDTKRATEDGSAEQETVNANEYMERERKSWSPGWGAGLKTLLTTGSIPGAIATGIATGKTKVNKEWGSADPMSPSRKQLGDAENKGNDDSPMEAQFRKTANPSAPATPPPSEQAAADDFDSFTQGARKKKGLQSTIVSGSQGGSGIAVNKKLLGT